MGLPMKIKAADYEQVARQRVRLAHALAPFEGLIFADWPQREAHIEWVATAPILDVLLWAQTIAQAMREGGEGHATTV